VVACVNAGTVPPPAFHCRVHAALPDAVRMLLPVHDSILLTVPQPLVEETRQIVRDAMETAPEGFTAPLKIDMKTGRTRAVP
jgi:DNA polymerase I